MKVLGIETSTQICSVGLADESGFVADYSLSGKTIHAEHLANAVSTVLEDASWDSGDLDGLAVSIGPGSFTGLRIGLALVKGMAFGLDIPVASVPTMDGLAAQVAHQLGTLCILMIARRGEVYRTIYQSSSDGWQPAGACEAIEVPQMLDGLPNEDVLFLGEGAIRSSLEIIQAYGSHAIVSADQALPSGYWIAALGLHLLESGKKVDIDQLIPQYFKRFQGVA